MTRVLVLGAQGMLGSMVSRVLAMTESIDLVRTTRHGSGHALAFDASHDSVDALLQTARCDWIVNAIGVLNGHIDENDPESVARAVDVNAAFPNRLAAAAAPGCRIIQIATDGVYAGRNAPYSEDARHDADGVYPWSKSLGEVRSPHVLNLRCSIVGTEERPAVSLLGWALAQTAGAVIAGYTNHLWNGVTTLHFARLCAAIITSGATVQLPSPLHVTPGDAVSKAELLRIGLAAFGRTDVVVSAQAGPEPMDRTLTTCHPETVRELWHAAGYSRPPTVAEMLVELAAAPT